MESKVGTMRDKEMDASKRTLKKRQMPHQRGGSNTGSLRTPKNTHNYLGGERGWSAVKSLPSQKYDIATLMAIGKNGGMNSIVSRFSSHSVESKYRFCFDASTVTDHAFQQTEAIPAG